jgi:ABC-type hemin transport system ATPase subunit
VLTGALYWLGAPRGRAGAPREVEEIIDFLEIQHVRKATAGTLSYGLRKRVELARAVAAQARLHPPRRADGRHEPRGEGRHGALHRRPQRANGG